MSGSQLGEGGNVGGDDAYERTGEGAISGAKPVLVMEI